MTSLEMFANERNQMKTKCLPYLGLAVAFQLACAGLARGDDASAMQTGAVAAPKLKLCQGTVAAVDPQQRTVSVKSVWRTRTFNAADSCTVALEDRPEASLADLRSGQKVAVQYENRSGVLVAGRIVQHNRIYTGHLSALDPVQRTFRVKHGLSVRAFTLADRSKVTLAGEKAGSLNDLKLGQIVRVVYESAKGAATAVRIEQKHPTFVGTIRAIDSDARTVRAKSLLSEKTFHLADGCKIVANGKMDASLKDLRIGDQAAFTYEDARGVLIASRIGREAAGPDTANAQASSATVYPAH
jgi:Cu/Ag efflux protein CusF